MIDTAMHTLEGLLRGISVDDEVKACEAAAVLAWAESHSVLLARPPFSNMAADLKLVAAGKATVEDLEDLTWLCQRFTTGNSQFDCITADLQALHGIAAGIAADGRITAKELDGLMDWLGRFEHLASHYPYDEIMSVVVDVMTDRIVTPEEESQLLGFFSDFCKLSNHISDAASVPAVSPVIGGICACDPRIEFGDRVFCLTGDFRLPRADVAEHIQAVGGHFGDSITERTDYLVVGAGGSPAWAYSCYGRKVERAIRLRKKGHPIVLVHESDFWSSIEDL